MKYVLLIEGRESGPYDRDEVQAAVEDGTIYATTLGRVEGGRDWEPLDQLLPKTKLADTSPSISAAGRKPRRRGGASSTPSRISRGQGHVVILLLLAGLGLAGWMVFKPGPRWEYQTLVLSAAAGSAAVATEEGTRETLIKPEDLGKLGNEGWEMVGGVPQGARTVLVFKRPTGPGFGVW